jgi:RNA polymerase sigma-70 factor (ECF subfamily)
MGHDHAGKGEEMNVRCINPGLPGVYGDDGPLHRRVAGDAVTGRRRVAEFDLAEIYARHRQGLFTLALSITRCAAQAEDAVHDAFARLFRARERESGRAVDDPVAYVFAAVRAAAIDQLRRAQRFEKAAKQRPVSIFVEDPEARATTAERAESVSRALDSLAPEQREIVVLRVYAGLSFAQIAGILAEPLPTVASRYRRSLERLKQHLEKLV